MRPRAPLLYSLLSDFLTLYLSTQILTMNRYITTASVLTALAMSMPLVSQAQDPMGSLKQVKALSAAGKTADAIKLCDLVINKFGNTKSAMARQFMYVLPLYAWEKGEIYLRAKQYDQAVEAFRAYSEDERWKDPALLQQAQAYIPNAGEAYKPYETLCYFKMGYTRYMQGAGDPKKNVAGDPAKMEEAIKYLEQYLDLLRKKKVSETEKKLRMDGQICFLLVQANILKPTPDFETANKYLELSRTVKGKVPENLAMDGLATIIQVAMKEPKNVGWVYKIIESSPTSYKLEPARSARYADRFLNFGIRAFYVADKAWKEGNAEVAIEATKAAKTLFGLVPDAKEVRMALAAHIKALGKYPKAIVDRNTGASYNAASMRKLAENYKKLDADNMELDGFAVLSTANLMYVNGSNRMAKAGYQVLIDRYPNLTRTSKDGEENLRNSNIFQLAQLCYATGDEEKGVKYEKLIEGEDMGDRTKNLDFNKMRNLLKEQKWAEVVAAAEKVKESYAGKPGNKFYASAQFSIVASHYKLQQYEDLINSATETLTSGCLTPSADKDSLKPAEAITYESQTRYFLMDAHMKLSAKDPKHLDALLAAFADYEKKFTSKELKQNPMGPNIYYTAIDCLLRRAGMTGDAEAAGKDKAAALELCKVITDNWPECDFYPNAHLLSASILIQDEDESVKPGAIVALEKATDAAIKLAKGKPAETAANALYWLASYGPEIPREGEDDAGRAARVRGYMDRFWKEADFEGNTFALQMASLEMLRASDKASFDKAVELTRMAIAREATYHHKNNTVDPELEKTINTYVGEYVRGVQKYDEKKLTLQEKADHFNNFPGINPEDKYANAIFRMALISSMNEELKALKDDEAATTALTNDIDKTFRDMTNTFKPADLTSFIGVQVGNYLVEYISRFADPSSKVEEIAMAVSYYDEVINRKKEMILEASLGKANALAYSKDASHQKTSEELYTKLSAGADPNITGPALKGLTELHMRTGNATAAIASARKYIDDRRNMRNRLDVMMMLGEAYMMAKDSKNALLTYMNLYGQNRGNILYSAPACKAMMEILWDRNNPSTGDRMKGTFKASDRWTAWNTGQGYVAQIKKAGIVEKMSLPEKDAFREVEVAVDKYAADSVVQKENHDNSVFRSKLNKK